MKIFPNVRPTDCLKASMQNVFKKKLNLDFEEIVTK
jgi:hypothetical protein